jgi:uncharacterized protein (DUF58 family)
MASENIERILERGTLFTARGLTLLILTVYLIGIPVREHQDIFAAVIAFSLVIWLTIFCIATATLSFLSFRSPPPLLAGPAADETFSKTPLQFFLNLPGLWTPPFYSHSFKINFERSDFSVSSPESMIAKKSGHMLPLGVTFPHRGVWIVKEIIITLKDRFGITSLSWRTSGPMLGSSFVMPVKSAAPQFPVIASQVTSGDDQIHVNNRLGEPFDIKPYHSSDGMKKIVWKIFAKNGILVSRHPEPTFSPEGEVCIFVAAGKEDDLLCSTAAEYVRDLKEKGLNVRVGCLGMKELQLAKTEDESLKLMIETVWDATLNSLRSSIDSFSRALRDADQADNQLTAAVLTSTSMMRSSRHIDSIISAFNTLPALGITPVFLVSEDQSNPMDTKKDGFYAACLDNRWEIIEAPVA